MLKLVGISLSPLQPVYTDHKAMAPNYFLDGLFSGSGKWTVKYESMSSFKDSVEDQCYC